MVLLQAWCDKMSLDTVMHPVTKCVIFLEDLLADMVEGSIWDNQGCSQSSVQNQVCLDYS